MSTSTPIAIIDYGMGNLRSIQNMLAYLGTPSDIVSEPWAVSAAEKIILPGVGAFDYAVEQIDDRELRDPLIEAAESGIPILGICLGMQLLFCESEEGTGEGLGLIPGRIRKFPPEIDGRRLRIPHMGWNTIRPTGDTPLMAELSEDSRFYFVHSFYAECEREDDVMAETEYGQPFVSAVSRENVAGVQFHPEKSHRYGVQLLTNFAERD